MMTARCFASGVDRTGQRDRPLDRLLDEQGRLGEPGQGRRLLDLAPQFDDALDVVVLLVAVEGRAVVAGAGVEHGGDAAEPLEIGRDVAADLQLVVAAAIVGHDLLEGLRQSVVHTLRRRPVGGGQRIDQADRVAHLDAGCRREAGQERAEIGVRDVRRQRGRADAGDVARDHGGEGLAGRLAQRVEDGPIEQCRPI